MSPTTIARLRGLKPGEACRWYAGDIIADIENSAPACAQLLTDLHGEVLSLEKRGFLVLTTRKASREVRPRRVGGPPRRVEVTEYTAMRVQP
jgi:hypothetical protein